MSKDTDESYFEEFFTYINDTMDGKYPYDELFKKYKTDEVLDVISHSTSTIFLTLARMDTEMDFIANLLNLIHYIRSGDNKYKALDTSIELYNKMTKMIIVELYTQIKSISEIGYDEEKTKSFKELVSDIGDIINSRDDFRENITTE